MNSLVEQLAATWTSVADLCAGLTEEQWATPTGCPGWTVKDQVSHLIDYESFALGRPRPEHTVDDVPHAKNDMGRLNEVGVDARRGRTGAEVLAEFRDVTAARIERLAELDEASLDDEAMTPIGPGKVRDLLTLRNMDSWAHEQDIRRALGRPGHTTGDSVATSVGYWCQFLPFAVGKKAGAPDGTSVVFHIGNLPAVAVVVEGSRARPADVPESPTVSLRMTADDFAALVGGRSDARPEDVDVAGDVELGRHIAAQLAFLP